MGKIETLSEHIDECNSFHGDNGEAIELITRIVGIYCNDIQNIRELLAADYDYKPNYLGAYTESTDITNYISRVKILEGKLINYRNNIELEAKRADRELELARFRQPNMTQTTNVSVNVTIDQTIELINQIPSTALCDGDKKDLIGDLCDMDKQKKLGSKEKAWDVAKKILGFLANKSADAAIAALPLVVKALQG